MRHLMMTFAAALAAGLAGVSTPVAAENTGFNFDEWFNNNVMNKPDDIPTVYISVHPGISNPDEIIYCETRASFADVPWCTGGSSPLFWVDIAVPSKGPRLAAKTDLEIGIDWTTATGQTGYGAVGSTRVIIRAGQFSTNAFIVEIPDDTIAHPCNKLIINLRSLTPDRYKIAPLNAGGSLVLNYVDDDGGNLDNKPCGRR